MEERGVITEAQRIALVNVLNSLPTNQAEIMQIVAAASIVGTNGAAQPLFTKSLGSESLVSTGPTDIVSLSSIPDGATKATITAFTKNIIFRVDGGNPGAATGHVLLANNNISLGDLSYFKFVAQENHNTPIFVSYY